MYPEPFITFLEALTRPNNQHLIQTIGQGYKTLTEATTTLPVKTIPKGTKLFHGTGEPFDVRDIRPGGYDQIFWTTDNETLSKYYIPVVGGYFIGEDPEGITRNILKQKDPWYTVAKKQLGISDNIIRAMYEKVKKINDVNLHWYKEEKRLQKIYNELEKEWDKDPHNEEKYKELKGVLDAWTKAEDNFRASPYVDMHKKLEKLVEVKMKKFGYETSGDYGKYKRVIFNPDDSNELFPADYQTEGKLITIIPKRDLKLYDYAQGRDPDLTDVDYHKHHIFDMAKEKGYDGIVITDFAQSEKHGNLGHISYGLFKDTLKDVDIKSKQKQVHPINESLGSTNSPSLPPYGKLEYDDWEQSLHGNPKK